VLFRSRSVASLRDVTYEWAVLREGREAGTARTQLKASGARLNEANEFSDFKRFSAKTGEHKLDAPKEGNPPQP
jgi:hypothetical protein